MKRSQQKAMFAKLNSLQPLPMRSNRLPVQVGVLVPSTEIDKPIGDKRFKQRVTAEQKYFNKKFGGTTSSKNVGAYTLNNKVIKEPVVLVSSSMTARQYKENMKALAQHFKQRQKQWKQDSVLVKVEGEDYIVPQQSFIATEKQLPKRILIS